MYSKENYVGFKYTLVLKKIQYIFATIKKVPSLF